MDVPLRLLTTAQDHFGGLPDYVIKVPDREMWLAAAPDDGHMYTLIVPDFNSRTTFDRRSAKQKQNHRARPLPRWARYAAGAIVWLGDQQQIDVPGFRAVVVGDEPAGPRYEYTLGMAVVAFAYHLRDDDYDLKQLVTLMEHVRRQYLD